MVTRVVWLRGCGSLVISGEFGLGDFIFAGEFGVRVVREGSLGEEVGFVKGWGGYN